MITLPSVQALVLDHPLISLAVLLAAIVAVAACWPEKGPGDGDDDNPNGGNWP